ncbi:hypothetical protein RF11_14962 [Thelohanellus kitauei]|uniref:Uncharacterized protein n=1 Tax=Thelohanellus kitauei TaxID=669202 RepID=A0A0C2NA58_THEKT|nr:hypothetical protein RF11_14962 [Thelohanellus kitauei]
MEERAGSQRLRYQFKLRQFNKWRRLEIDHQCLRDETSSSIDNEISKSKKQVMVKPLPKFNRDENFCRRICNGWVRCSRNKIHIPSLMATGIRLEVCHIMTYQYPLSAHWSERSGENSFDAPPTALADALREAGVMIFQSSALTNTNLTLLLCYMVFFIRTLQGFRFNFVVLNKSRKLKNKSHLSLTKLV